jgi:hypothetical protein
MSGPIGPHLYGDLVEVASKEGFEDWLSMVRATGGCANPIHLWGESTTLDVSTGEVFSRREPGRLLVACGNRRTTRCPACSETYRADTYQLIRAGLVGGKAVPTEVSDHPRVFATFTAPGFGAVHTHRCDKHGRPRRCHPAGLHRCLIRHRATDPRLGQPLDPSTYDYIGAVIWNGLSTRLWARTVQLTNRRCARLLGIRQSDWPASGRVSVAKVAEYQARGLVHFHAVFRLDGPRPELEPPAGATTELLAAAIQQAAVLARVAVPVSPAFTGVAPIVWGEQLDLKPIGSAESDRQLSDQQVAGYIAKYATKGADVAGGVDRPLACRPCHGLGSLDGTTCADCKGTGRRNGTIRPAANPHAQRMIDTCWTLGGLPELSDLRLRPWAHMLGFRGHFSTKSRRYSTTLTRLRRARRDHRDAAFLSSHDLEPDTTLLRIHDGEDGPYPRDYDDAVLVIGRWRYVGRGHTPGEAVFAATVAHDLAVNRRLSREQTPR